MNSPAPRQAMTTEVPNNLEAFWMPFSANRQFKKNPRLLVGAKDMHYFSHDGRKILDGLSGLWCTGLGHCREEITLAVSRQVARLDYAPAFQYAHPLSFELANRIKQLMPDGLEHVFFTGSGSEAADTSLKMARAYWRARGKASKTRLIGREKGYHGVNFGGISVGGIGGNRKVFGQAVDSAIFNGVHHAFTFTVFLRHSNPNHYFDRNIC